MIENLSLQPSEELAYWVGVVQSDGSFCSYVERSTGKIKCTISVGVSEKSLKMLEQFGRLSFLLFKRKGSIFKSKTRKVFYSKIGVKNCIRIFQGLGIKFGDPPIPPIWTMQKPEFFGAYLAGLIDGDGTATIKRPKYPQCSIRISSGSKQLKLAEYIRNILKCSVWISSYKNKKRIDDKIYDCKWTDLEFLVSSKTYNFFINFILPYIQLDYKKDKIERYINSRWISN